MPLAFLSYARELRPQVEILADDLDALGIAPWFDRAVSGGQKWWDEVISSICRADYFLFAIAKESLESVACQRELAYAQSLGKPIVPVVVDDDFARNLLPTILAQTQHVDYTHNDKAALKTLARALRAHKIPASLPSPLPTPPPAPISYLSSLRDRVEMDAYLSFEAQSTLLVELRRASRDPNDSTDVSELLIRLRKRKDLLAAIADEIEALLAEIRTQMTPRVPPPEEPSTQPIGDFFDVIRAAFDKPRPANKPATKPARFVETSSKQSGSCPNCLGKIPLDSKACPECGALFGEHSAWKVLRY